GRGGRSGRGREGRVGARSGHRRRGLRRRWSPTAALGDLRLDGLLDLRVLVADLLQPWVGNLTDGQLQKGPASLVEPPSKERTGRRPAPPFRGRCGAPGAQ